MLASDISPSEYAPYYKDYIDLAGEHELITALQSSFDEIKSLLLSIPESAMENGYAEGKWSIKEMLLHLIDTERVFAYRALRFARRDQTELPGFDQDIFVANSRANERSKESLLREYNHVRDASISLFSSFEDSSLKAVGIANGSKTTVRAMGFIIVGHEQHHARIIRERYL